MQSRALPFNGAVGCVTLMGAGALSGAALTSPTLNLDADTSYEFEGSVKLGAAADLRFFFNADTSGANYDRCVTTVTAPTTPVALNANNSILRASGASGDVVRFSGKICKDVENHPYVELSYSVLSTSSLLTAKETIVWRTTGANVVAFQINQSTGSLTSGQMWVYKRSPLIALNNAANLDVTANPSNPVHLQRVRRVDATTIANLGGPAWVYYDATLAKWLTEELFRQPITANEDVGVNGTTGNNPRGRFFEPTYDVYVGRIIVQSYVATTSNGSNKYTPTFNGFSGTPSFTTGADAANTFVNHSFTLGTITTAPMGIQIDSNKVGAPGPLYLVGHIQYRLVIP